MDTLGTRIRHLREARGMYQKHLADQLGINLSSLSYYETDKRLPTLAILINLARVFGVTTDYLLQGEPADQDPQAEAMARLVRALLALPVHDREVALRVLGVLVWPEGKLPSERPQELA